MCVELKFDSSAARLLDELSYIHSFNVIILMLLLTRTQVKLGHRRSRMSLHRGGDCSQARLLRRVEAHSMRVAVKLVPINLFV